MESFGPVIAIREHAPERRSAFDRAFTNAIVRWNRGRDSGPVEIAYQYLLVVARRVVRIRIRLFKLLAVPANISATETLLCQLFASCAPA
jgi:hypothetical protein